MKILFISDFTLKQRQGGAQVSNDLIIKKGRELGHEIIEHDHTSSIVDFLSSYDLVINSNLEAITQTSPEKFNYIKKLPNSVRLEHDSCLYLKPQDRQDLFKNAKINFFLTQYHHRFFTEMYGDYFENVEIVYDPIDTSIFKKSEDEKIYDVVYCGYLHHLKGLNNLISFAQENPDRKVSIFGWGDQDYSQLFNSIDNVEFLGMKSHEEIAEVFQKSKALFHAPIVNEPFCRMIGEALLCGVEEIIGETDRIGAYLEFNEVGYDKFKQGCQNAAEIFWSKINNE